MSHSDERTPATALPFAFRITRACFALALELLLFLLVALVNNAREPKVIGVNPRCGIA